MNRMALSCVGVACMLVLFCYRIWGLGITHHDDAMWFLATQQGNWGVVKDFAIQQGRVWAFVSGTLMYMALYLDGSYAGDAVRVGSLAIFFILFYSVIAVYFGRRVALMSAAINLAFYAVRWEGSIVNAYPLFSWVLMSIFLCAVLLAWRYAHTKRLVVLYAAFASFFLSLFLHEGVSVLFAMLFTLSIFANHYLVEGNFPSINAVLNSVASRRQLTGALVLIAAYFVIYFAWRLVFPSNYNGNTLHGSSVLRVVPTLLGLSASGSILSDVVHPYTVNFSDSVGKDSYSVTYSVLSYLRAVGGEPSAFLVAIIICVTIFLIANSDSQSGPGHNVGRLTIGGITVGALIALVPIFPVALVEKYQHHFFELGIHSYIYTALSHFGITLGISCLLLWVVSFCIAGSLYRNLLSILIALSIAIMAFCGSRMNDAITHDIRIETSRWKVVDKVTEMASQLAQPISSIYAPRLFSGSWFTVLDTAYWSQYVSVRRNKAVNFTRDPIPIPLIEKNNAAFMDFILERNSSQSVIVLAPLEMGIKGGTVIASRIVVAIERPDPSDLARYVLYFRDMERGPVEVRFSQLDLLDNRGEVRGVSRIAAIPDSIRISRFSIVNSLPIGCGKSFLSGTTIVFGTTNLKPVAGTNCIADGLLGEGWNLREQAGVWSKVRNAMIDFPTNGLPRGSLMLTLSIGTFAGLGFHDLPQSVTIRKDASVLATRTDKKGMGFHEMSFKIPSNAWVPGKDINLSIDVDHTINPAKEKLSSDTRDLGVYIRSLNVEVVKAED